MKKNSHLRDFARYASLNVLGMIGVSCYILADTFFVAKGMGADGVTALNIAIPIYSLIHGTGLMIGMGGATKFAITKVRDVTKQEAEFSPVHCLWLWCLERYTFWAERFSQCHLQSFLVQRAALWA